MFLLKNLLLASATITLAAPTWPGSYNDMESRDLDHFDINARDLDAFDYLEARDLSDFDLYGLYARAKKPAVQLPPDPRFARTNADQKEKAIEFVRNTGPAHLSIAAAPGTSAKTIDANGKFHLDRQQPKKSEEYASKVAVQLNDKNLRYTTVGQVVVKPGPDPDPRAVAAKLTNSILSVNQQTLNPQAKHAKEAEIISAQAKKAERLRKAQADAHTDAKVNAAAGVFKKGNDKPSVQRGT